MDGWWDCDAIYDLLSHFLAVKADFSITNHLNPANLHYILQSKFTSMQSARRAFQVGERLLDIGCGRCGLAAFAAERCSVAVTGVTSSREQKTLAETRCAGLPVDI